MLLSGNKDIELQEDGIGDGEIWIPGHLQRNREYHKAKLYYKKLAEGREGEIREEKLIILLNLYRFQGLKT